MEKCLEILKAKLEEKDDWDTINKDHSNAKLMKSIRDHMIEKKEDLNPELWTYAAISTLFCLRNCGHENLGEYRMR